MQSLTTRALSKHTNNDTGAHTYTCRDTDTDTNIATHLCVNVFFCISWHQVGLQHLPRRQLEPSVLLSSRTLPRLHAFVCAQVHRPI